ncbi:ABC transporter ATP-binding protein [Maritalea sp. S77]|uniref:iron ABC transporter ATP-binding protein n=1 Tax=Maritalea sp. S77 TaxID=3415125 RepID=UPI003C7ACACF
MISVRNLTHQLDQQTILNDLSLTIPKGKVTALVGANGAGKSTLLSLMARLMKLQDGQILIDNMSVGETPNDALARKLSILPQAIQLEPRLTVRELVSFGRYPHAKGRMQKQDWDKVDEALSVLDLNELADRQLDTLSGGQRQRAYVAMTYAQDTEYMLLDEPLNNMDIAASRSLMRVLRELCEHHGRTIVIVLHDINYASGYADNVVALADGKIDQEGTPLDVVDSAFLHRIYGTDAKVHILDDRPYVQV